MVRHKDPEWTSEDIMKVRKIYRSGGTIQDVADMLHSTMNLNAIRNRSIKFGMRFL